jgi:anti-anti-sigma regulatory factor
MDMNRPSARVRTFRIATGAHFVSFVRGDDSAWPTLADELERLPRTTDLVINLDDLGVADASTVASTLTESDWLRQSARRAIVVCPHVHVRRALERSGLSEQVLLEETLEGGLRHVLGGAWLAGAAGLFGRDDRSEPRLG